MVKSPFALEAGAWTQKPHTSKYLEVTVELNSWITGHACRRSIWQRYFRRWLQFWLKYKAIFIFSFPVYGSHATPCFNNEFKLILCSAFFVDFGSNLFVSQYQCQFSRESILKKLFVVLSDLHCFLGCSTRMLSRITWTTSGRWLTGNMLERCTKMFLLELS